MTDWLPSPGFQYAVDRALQKEIELAVGEAYDWTAAWIKYDKRGDAILEIGFGNQGKPTRKGAPSDIYTISVPLRDIVEQHADEGEKRLVPSLQRLVKIAAGAK